MVNFNIESRDCLSKKEVYNYISAINEMEKDEIRSIENHLVECELCGDAIDGYMFLKEADPNGFEEILLGDNPTTTFIPDQSTASSSPIQAEESRGKVFHMPFKPDPSNLDETTPMDLPKKTKKPFLILLNRVAAVGLIFVLIAGIYYYIDGNKNGELLAMYSDGSEYGSNLRGENGVNSSIDDAIDVFSQEKYSESAERFQNIFDQSNQENHIAAFYLGLSYMNLKEWSSAETYLSKTANSSNEFTIDAQFYLSKIYLVNGNKKQAKELLAMVKESERKDLKDKATAILSQWE